MKRITTAACLVAFGAMSLVACGGSDDKGSAATDGGAVETTAGGSDTTADGGTDGSVGTIGDVPGVSEECTDLYNQYIKALGAVGGGTGEAGDISGVFDALKKVLPAELADDADLLSQTWAKYEDVIAKYDGDVSKAMSDPDAMAIIQTLSDEKVNDASNAIGDYFSDTCPQG